MKEDTNSIIIKVLEIQQKILRDRVVNFYDPEQSKLYNESNTLINALKNKINNSK